MCALFDRGSRKGNHSLVCSGAPFLKSERTPKLRRKKRTQLEVLEDRQLLATITVNTTADSTTAGATLSLRQAIEVSDGSLAVSSLRRRSRRS